MKIISHETQIKAGCFDLNLGISVAEETLRMYHNGEILFPDKVSQIFNQEEQTRINCLPATVLPKSVCGMKWVAVFPPNPVRYHCPNLNASILLSEITTGYPIAFMDGTLCSDIRTASVSAVAAKYLARKDSEVIGFLGGGEQARMHLLAISKVLPNLKVCKIATRRKETETAFIDQMRQLLPDMTFITCDADYEKAATDSDVIVTAISAQLPLLKAAWIKPGAYYNHVGGWEDEYEVPKIADKIVCDDWNSVKHRTQTISRLYQKGELKDEDIHADLHEIVTGSKPGRESESEIIYFNPVGLSYVDVSLAYEFYKKALELESEMPTLDFFRSSVFETAKEFIKN